MSHCHYKENPKKYSNISQINKFQLTTMAEEIPLNKMSENSLRNKYLSQP